VKNATVIGHSLGGAVATALAEQSPDLVAGVGILDTEPDTSYGTLDLLARSVYAPVIGEALWRVKMDWSIRNALEEAFAPGYEVPDQFVDDVKQMTYTAYEDTHSGFDSYVGESPLDQRLRALAVPVLVAFGAKDQVVDAREALSAYADIPDAQTAMIQGSGHSPNVEKPAETTRLILGFANSNQAPDTTAAGTGGSGKGAAGGKIVVTCEDLRFDGPGPPDWRKHSAVAGPLGLGGAGRDFQNASRIGGVLEAKLPALVEGRQPVILRVPRSERGQVGLVYGGFHRVRAVSAEAQQVTFVPCKDKPRTVWPGALALANRNRITLEVVVAGSVKKLRIG
jgi:alpha/beta hydrolase family protein